MQVTEHFIPGKDASLEASIATLQSKLAAIGFHIEERSWLNPVEGVWSVHIRDRDCPLLFTNGKGASELAARASALGEYFEPTSIWARRSPSAAMSTIPTNAGLFLKVTPGRKPCSRPSCTPSTIPTTACAPTS